MTLTTDQRKAIGDVIIIAWIGFAILLAFFAHVAMNEIGGIEGYKTAMICYDGTIWVMLLFSTAGLCSFVSQLKKKIADLNLQVEELMMRVQELEKTENNRA